MTAIPYVASPVTNKKNEKLKIKNEKLKIVQSRKKYYLCSRK
jgi:hypothetical protein